jgi:hypothetical protein
VPAQIVCTRTPPIPSIHSYPVRPDDAGRDAPQEQPQKPNDADIGKAMAGNIDRRFAWVAADGTICGHQKLGRIGLEKFGWHVKRGALDLARLLPATRGRVSVLRKRGRSAKRASTGP